MAAHIAVLDIGKTNKKLLIFDESLNILDSRYERIDEYTEGGVIFEDIDRTVQWFKDGLKQYSSQYEIACVSVATHGATYVCVDENGERAVPLVAYTTDPGAEFHDFFYQTFGDAKILQRQTATPNFGNLINPAKGLFFLKNKYPDGFSKIAHILFFPQYFGYLLTGCIGCEPTYVGCHTYLWDFEKNTWSGIARDLGIDRKLPDKMSRPWDILGTVTPRAACETGLSEKTIVTMGIHDSNSSMLPYLVKRDEDFTLNSTGTWCVAMHKEETVCFEDEELGKVVFYNLSAFNDPVKTAIFLGGLEFDHYLKIIKKITGKNDFPQFDADRYERIFNDKELFILPTIVPGTGQFPDSTARVIEKGETFSFEDIQTEGKIPAFFKDFDTAFSVLIASLVIQTKAALDCIGTKNGRPIYIEGGFSKNKNYTALLGNCYPDSEISLTSLDEATAFGAAMIGQCALLNITPAATNNLFEIEYQTIAKTSVKGFDGYMKKFLDYTG